MRKTDVQIRKGNPCVNVKAYNFARGLDVSEVFGCDEKTAEKALEYAFQSACECFWEQAEDTAQFHLGSHVKIFSEGRQSGWLVVHNMPSVESWDAIQLSKWARFEKAIRAEVDYVSSAEQVRDNIEANQWAKPGAELFNFVDSGDGQTHCLADLKAKAIESGFGAVVRL